MKDKLSLTYTEKDGLLYPNISTEGDSENSGQPVGRFGRDWMNNLHRNHRQRFMTLRMMGNLEATARRVDTEALERQEAIYQQLLTADPPPQTVDTMVKARHLNSLRLIAEEIVMTEIVLKPR